MTSAPSVATYEGNDLRSWMYAVFASSIPNHSGMEPRTASQPEISAGLRRRIVRSSLTASVKLCQPFAQPCDTRLGGGQPFALLVDDRGRSL